MGGLGLIFRRRAIQAHPTITEGGYLFAEGKGDPEVFRILMEKGVSSDGVGITKDDAARVTDISTWFYKNEKIVDFIELQYFTGLSMLNKDAFNQCTNLQRVAIPCDCAEGGNTDHGVFRMCTSLTEAEFTNDNITRIAGYTFYKCSALNNLALPPKTTEIGYRAFEECGSLETIENWAEIAANLTLIEGRAFEKMPLNAGNLIAPNLQTLQGSNFGYTSMPMVLDLGGIKTLARSDNGLFSSTDTSVAIFPETLTTIENYVFYKQNGLRTAIFKSTNPPTKGTGGNDKLRNCTIYVPDSSVESYIASEYWSALSAKIKGISSLSADNSGLYEQIKQYL